MILAATDLTALRAHLRAHPDDWESWLVYGDWLLEEGDVRGKLIQLEHRLAVKPMSEGASSALREEIELLVAENQRSWLNDWECPHGMTLQWRHGFVFGVAFERCRDVSPLRALVAHPTGHFLTSLRMRSMYPTQLVSALQGLGELPLRALIFTDPFDHVEPYASTLARTPALRTLASLDLSGARIDANGAMALAESAMLGALTELNLHGNLLGDEGAAALAASSGLRGLTRLSLRGAGLSDAGVLAIARSETLRSLTELDLGYNAVGAVGAKALAHAGGLRSLKTLALDHTALGPEGAKALAEATVFGSLTELDIDRSNIGNKGALALARSTSLRSLTRLCLRWNRIGARARAALEQSTTLPRGVLDW